MGVETIVIQEPTRIFIGRPASPMPADRVEGLAARLRAMPGIAAAYLPMVFGLPGQAHPAQVLIVKATQGADHEALRRSIGEALDSERLTPIDMLLDPGDDIVASAAGTGCVIVERPRPKWKFW